MLKERLIKFIKSQGLTISAFETKVGLSNGSVSRTNDNMRRRTVEAIIAVFPRLNETWLLTGEGEMLKQPYKVDEIEIPTKEEIDAIKADIKSGHVSFVPLIPTAALANSLSEFLGPGIRKMDCQNIISPVPGAEFAIQISGDSMEPKFQDGMIVFLKRINDSAFIPWGNTLVLDTENGAFIKNVFPCNGDENMIEARSINPLYPTMRIPKTSVFGMYRVLNATKFFTTM